MVFWQDYEYYERVLKKPRREARDLSRDAGLEALAPRSPVSKDEQATIAKRKREAGSAGRATPGGTKRQPDTREVRAAEAAVCGGGRRDREPTMRREAHVPEDRFIGRGRRGHVAQDGRTATVAVGGDSRRERGLVTGMVHRDAPMPPRRSRGPDGNEDGLHRGGGVVARRDTRGSVRRSRSRSREGPGPVVPGLDLHSALAYVEQHLPGLNALIVGRGRGRGRPRGRAMSTRMTRAGPRRVTGRAGLGYDEEDGDL